MMQSSKIESSTPSLRAFLVAGFGLILIIKLGLASILDLYSDEIFYWQASTHPALAYSDLPFVTAPLSGIGSSLVSGNALAVRIIFLLMGSTLPFLIFWIAKPITGSRRAIEASVLSLCLPLGASLGMLAVPDVPIIFFGMLAIGLFERAIRIGEIRIWVGIGFIVALGFSTHYRFFLYPAAAVLFLIISKDHRELWKKSGLWIAIFISLLGLYPIVSFNILNQLSSASFYFAERHPWEFQSEGLLHVFKQALVVTPPLYLVFGITLVYLFRLAKKGDYRAKLFLCFSLVNLLVFFILAPWTDNDSTSIHWPLSGYFALLVFVPDSLRICYEWLADRWGKHSAKKITFSVPIIGFIGTLIGLVGVGSQAFQTQLRPVVGDDVLSNKMAGWQEFAFSYNQVLSRHFDSSEVVAITDNYYTSAQLEFAGLATQTYNLDHDKAVEDGREAQYRIWQQDEASLYQVAGKAAIFITEDSTLTIPDKTEIIGLACTYLENLHFIEQLWLFGGAKRFTFYKTDAIRAEKADETQNCPYPSQGWLQSPVEGDILNGATLFTGWVFNEGVGVDEVNLLIDGIKANRIEYGIARPDVVDVMEVNSDPNLPNLGFDYLLDTTAMQNGEVEVALELINKVGERQIYGRRTVKIANP